MGWDGIKEEEEEAKELRVTDDTLRVLTVTSLNFGLFVLLFCCFIIKQLKTREKSEKRNCNKPSVALPSPPFL